MRQRRIRGELSCRAWDEEASEVASGLQQFGIARGEVVGRAFDGREWLELAVAGVPGRSSQH